jgi:GTP cyclohydrolase II
VGDGRPVLVRVQTACFTGDVLGSLACDCRARFEAAMARVAEEGRGVLVYLRSARGTAGVCEIQLRRAETVEAEQRLGLRGTQREYGIGAQILRDLGVTQVRLLTNQPHQMVSLYGLVVVERVPLQGVGSDHATPLPDRHPGSSTEPLAPIAGEHYRDLAGSFPTGVTIVTTLDPRDDSPRGLTSQTFVGLSTEPPLIMVALDKSSRTLPALLRSRAFVVNFLKHGAEDLADRFASKDEDKFRELEWTPSTVAAGAPILRDHVVAYAECVVVEIHEAGDHWIFVGSVHGGEMLGGTPLLYYRRAYAPWPQDEPRDEARTRG